MAKRSITVDLDDETIRDLALHGEPSDVLASLADSAAKALRRFGADARGKTDRSLQTERTKTDSVLTKERQAIEGAADEVVRIARRRADAIVQVARDAADDKQSAQSAASEASSERARTRADGRVEDERVTADAVLEHERSEVRRHPAGLFADVREATDQDLIGERAGADMLIVDQREANAEMVRATIRAHDLAIEADAAKERAEESGRELRAVAEFREMFIGILGHDLRNPLGSIVMTAAHVLERGRLDDQDAERMARIIRNSQRMTRMIAQLTDLTRARLGGGLPLEPKPTNLREVCQRVVEEFEAAIQVEMDDDMTGTWDEDRLAEALSNLARNALDYAAPGTVVLVKAHPDGDAVVVEVANEGEPIPADVLPFIFEPFRRAQQHQKSAAGNLGLGLYIAKQIVLSHGGTIEARSAGGTTRFVMRLPRRPPTSAG